MKKSTQVIGTLILVLLASVVGLYGQFLWNPIVFDDTSFFLVDNAGNQPVSTYRFAFLELRSLPYASLAWTKAWLGLDLINFRVGNLLLHAAVVMSLFFFLTLLFTTVVGDADKNRMTPRLAAFFAASLFALHPISTYAVGYLVQRTMVMATLFSLLAMLVYLYGSVKEKPIWVWLSVPFYYLAVFSKEHVIMLPAVLMALTMLIHANWRVKLKQQWTVFSAFALVALFVVMAKRGVLGSAYEPALANLFGDDSRKFAYPLSVLTQSLLFFKYAILWALPDPRWMSIDMREPIATSLVSVYLLPLLCFIAWGLCGLWLLLKRGLAGLVGFSMLFPWLMFMTEFSAVRIQEVFVLYRSYIWSVGGFCLLPILVSRIGVRIASFVLALVACTFFVLSMERLIVMSEPWFLWDDAEKLVKGRDDLLGAYRIYYNRGTSALNLGMVDKAIPDFERTIKLSKQFADGYHNLGSAYAAKDDFAKAIPAYKLAIEVSAKNGMELVTSHGNLAIAYAKTGETSKAIDQFTTAISITKKQRTATGYPYYLGRAEAYEKLGEFQKAQADYQEACTRAKKGCDKLTAANGNAVK